MKLIVHAGTGTIIDADDGVFVIDTDIINDDALGALLDDGDEDEIVELAKDKGRRISGELLEMSYRNCVAFTPTALRFEAIENDRLIRILQGVDGQITEWVDTTSARNLDYVADLIMNDEVLWERYTDIVGDAIIAAYNKDQENRRNSK